MARLNKPAGDNSVSPKPTRTVKKGNGGTHGLSDPAAIARRAYEIYLGRGGTHGADLDDGLEAERQLKPGLADLTGPAPVKPKRRKSSASTAL